MLVIQSRRIWIAGQFVAAQLVVKGERIEEVLPYRTLRADADYGSDRILPGFIDLHTHGAFGYDTNDANPEGLKTWIRQIPREGVTSILPTTVTQLPDILMRALESVAEVAGGEYTGAHILGVHFEGPYLDMQYKGAQPPEAIATPDIAQFQRYQEAAGGLIRYITLAPEHDQGYALTRYCSQNGVVVSIGHSSASYEQAIMAVANGARSMTHVYNGMSPFHHRYPGLVGAALRLEGVYGEVIGDGKHSHPAALHHFFQTKGKDYGILITDSLRAKYCPPGKGYELGGHPVEIGQDGLARLEGTDTIAGSTLRMNEGLRLLVEEAMVPFETAINACTLNPARCLGVDDRKGRIGAGCDADLAVLGDDYSLLQTYCRGKACL